MAVAKYLIVNADDLGQSEGINRGIMAAHDGGIVTSASLMVRGQAAMHAAGVARAHPDLGVGLHIDLGEWVFCAGAWVELYRHVDADDAEAAEAEVAYQLEEFRKLIGRDPTHLDSHQHVHRKEPVGRIVTQLGACLRVPVRHFTPGVTYCGDFYGQDDKGQSYPNLVTAASLIAILERLTPGVTELSCHPGETDFPATMYVWERRDEVNALCDPSVRATIDELDVKLITFRDFDLEAT